MKKQNFYNLLNTPLIIAVINLKSLMDIGISLVQSINAGKNMIQINWFDFFIQIIVSTMLWIFIRKYFELKNDMEVYFYVFKIILDIKTKRLFVKDYANVNTYPLLNETVESYLARHPEHGLYYDNLVEEREIVKKEIMTILKEKKVSDIDEIIELMYPEIINYKK